MYLLKNDHFAVDTILIFHTLAGHTSCCWFELSVSFSNRKI